MQLDDLIYQTGEWLKGTGPHSDIVMSSRVRLARNLSKLPFPNKAPKKTLDEILELINKTIAAVDYFKDAGFFKIIELDNVDRKFLIERHLMSHEHASNPDGKALVISREEILSVMVNEEDHLRVQVMQSGLNLDETWRIISSIDEELSQKLQFAYFTD